MTIHLLKWPKSRTLTTSNADKDVEQQALSYITGGNAKCCSDCGKQFGVLFFFLLTKLNIGFPYDPANMLLGIDPKEIKISVHIEICT